MPSSLLEKPVVAAISMALLVIATLFSIREARLINSNTYTSQVPSILLLAGLFGVIIFGWF